MNILLINVAKGYVFISPKKEKMKWTGTGFVPPLGLLYIASSLEDDGHSVKIIDYFCEKDAEKTMYEFLKSADVVGLSIYTNSQFKAADIARLIKNKYPDIPIIIGGPHCIFFPDRALDDIPEADFCIEGEGEQTIKCLISAIEKNKSFSDITGLYYREKQKIKKGKPPEVISNIDNISFPSRHLVEKYIYGVVNNSYFFKPKFTSMVTSRGCPFKCRFCTRHVSTMKNYRKRSVENVLEEFQIINEKYNSVMISDDNFLCDKKWAFKILDGIIKNGIDLELYIQGARVDTADRELYEKMRKAGVKHVYYGIESGCQDVLDYYNKNINLDQINYAVNLAHKMNFFILGTFILGSIIETKEHIDRTINFACSLPLDLVVFQPLLYERGSDLWNDAVKDKLISEGDKYYYVANKKLGLSQFTQDELISFCKEANKRFYFRFGYFFREITSSIMRGDFRFLKIAFKLLR